ncbi:hypothetical protein Nps_00500 [Candidatus Nanopusillus acidilobi]|nr:hypothetical protein Nps_00500 [Candidatus Nanopusillus acidilobi]
MENWFWIVVTIIAFGLSIYLYFKFANINNQTQLLYQDIYSCQNLYSTVEEVCYSNNGTGVYINIEINKYLNYIYSNNNLLSCYIYDKYYNYTIPCNVIINTTNNMIQYYTSGLFYELSYGNPNEKIPLLVEKTSPTQVTIYIENPS